MLTQWNPEPAPFGNASGLDLVSLDVKGQIAHRLGVAVTCGHLPDGYKIGPADERYGYADAVTISHDGLTVSWEFGSNVSVRGYKSSDVPVGPETIVFDVSATDWERAKQYAIRGPMLGVGLPPGTVSKLGPIDEAMQGVADAYLAPYGGLEAVQ